MGDGFGPKISGRAGPSKSRNSRLRCSRFRLWIDSGRRNDLHESLFAVAIHHYDLGEFVALKLKLLDGHKVSLGELELQLFVHDFALGLAMLG
jgi:hypothetical protein